MTAETEVNPAAAMWGSTGAAYDGISFGLSDAISHTVQLLWPRSGEQILDIGTGTGWAARLAARRGAHVTGIDIAPGMLDAAAQLAAGTEPMPEFLRAPAESLPFEDDRFNGVMSTYGVIFTPEPAAAIDEMARVVKPGGRIALATWLDAPEGYIAEFFGLIGRWSDAPPPSPSPFDWGRPDWIESAFDGRFDVACREQETLLYAPDVETVWTEYLEGFGPVAATHAALPEENRSEFRDAFLAFHRPYETHLGVVIPRRALLVRGIAKS